MSSSKFIRPFHLKRAAQLLVENKLRITEVAYMLGFGDPNYVLKKMLSGRIRNTKK